MSETVTNLPNGTSQLQEASPNLGISEALVNFSGPNASGTVTSQVAAFTNGGALTVLNHPDGSLAEIAATNSGTGNPGETSLLNAFLGTNAFTVAATNSTISSFLASFSDGGNGLTGVLTGAFIDYTDGTSAVFQNTPSGPAETNYSAPNGTGTVLGASFFGTGTDLGTAFAIAASLPPSHG
jgi:hypothetical protein